jgi:hypothetical protein
MILFSFKELRIYLTKLYPEEKDFILSYKKFPKTIHNQERDHSGNFIHWEGEGLEFNRQFLTCIEVYNIEDELRVPYGKMKEILITTKKRHKFKYKLFYNYVFKGMPIIELATQYEIKNRNARAYIESIYQKILYVIGRDF